MKTFQQFQSDSQQLDEGKVALAKMALKGLSKVARKVPVMKKIGKSITKTPVVKKVGKVIKNLRAKPKESDYVRMYHGTTEKAANRFMDKQLKAAGKAGEDGRTILKNVGDQHSAIYKAPGFKGNPTDAKIDSTFNKNVLGAPTTTNIPKGSIPDVEKKLKARSIIRKFKRRKK